MSKNCTQATFSTSSGKKVPRTSQTLNVVAGSQGRCHFRCWRNAQSAVNTEYNMQNLWCPLHFLVVPGKRLEKTYLSGRSHVVVIDYYSWYIEITKLLHRKTPQVDFHLSRYSQIMVHSTPPLHSVTSWRSMALNTPQAVPDILRPMDKQRERLKLWKKKWRSIPGLVGLSCLENGYSPAQLPMGRSLRTTTPVLQSSWTRNYPIL